MKKEFIPYEQALELRDLGFDENYFACYSHDGRLRTDEAWKRIVLSDEVGRRKGSFKAPLYQQAFRWFREKHGLCNFINFSGDGFCSGWEDLGNNEHGFENFKTYEEAELECLVKLIDIVKKNEL